MKTTQQQNCGKDLVVGDLLTCFTDPMAEKPLLLWLEKRPVWESLPPLTVISSH